MTEDLVPFGKHKGQPVEVLMSDAGYREWLMAQSWFRDRYPIIYQTIVNYGGEPQETPEHNELQASFLNDERCMQLAQLLLPKENFNGTNAKRMADRALARVLEGRQLSYSTPHPVPADHILPHLAPEFEKPRIWGRKFEDGGWDIVFNLTPTALFVGLTSYPTCTCHCDHEADCPGGSRCHGGDQERLCRHSHHDGRFVPSFGEDIPSGFAEYKHCNRSCPWSSEMLLRWMRDDEDRFYVPPSRRFLVECKPDLGDDFPAVLRQVTRYDSNHDDVRCVIVRRQNFTTVAWEQVTEIFRASGITLVPESTLAETPE